MEKAQRLELEECIGLLTAAVKPITDTETLPIQDATDRVLAEDVKSFVNVPSFPRSAMDGYAVKAADTKAASDENPVTLRILGEMLAGDYKEFPSEEKSAVRIMTGAYIPNGFDSVIMQEMTNHAEFSADSDSKVAVFKEIKAGANYIEVGEDIREGDLIAKKGELVTPVHVGLFASAGVGQVKVKRKARVSIISTGSELLDVSSSPVSGKIYNSILYTLCAAVKKSSQELLFSGTCADDEAELESFLKKALENSDIVITTGGVSVGNRDIVPDVIKSLGGKELFSRTNLQPGMHTKAYVLGKTVILALSGNPYSAIANFEMYYFEILAKLFSCEKYLPKIKKAVFKGTYEKINGRRRLLRAFYEDGIVCLKTGVHQSSVISNMLLCNCFVDLKEGCTIKDGDTVTVRMFSI